MAVRPRHLGARGYGSIRHPRDGVLASLLARRGTGVGTPVGTLGTLLLRRRRRRCRRARVVHEIHDGDHASAGVDAAVRAAHGERDGSTANRQPGEGELVHVERGFRGAGRGAFAAGEHDAIDHRGGDVPELEELLTRVVDGVDEREGEDGNHGSKSFVGEEQGGVGRVARKGEGVGTERGGVGVTSSEDDEKSEGHFVGDVAAAIGGGLVGGDGVGDAELAIAARERRVEAGARVGEHDEVLARVDRLERDEAARASDSGGSRGHLWAQSNAIASGPAKERLGVGGTFRGGGVVGGCANARAKDPRDAPLPTRDVARAS